MTTPNKEAQMPATVTGPRRARVITTGVLAGALALAAGCGSSAANSGGSAATHRPMAHASSHPMAGSAAFGPDCGMIPSSGMGSLHSMSMDSVVTAASHNPLLSTFASDVRTAGLAAGLTSMHALTIFAPADSAFRKVPAAQMSMMHNAPELAKILKGHVVDGRVTPAELAHGMTLTTLAGTSLKASRMGSVYEVGNAHVLCGNIHTANATVYVIDKVLEPMH
jgi:uncharacterized surface protein with fasciclin (FAS1) repeats